MAITNGFPKDEKQVVDSALSTTSTNPVQNAIVTQNLNNKANTSSVLTKTNTTAFTPTADYHPATKAYVDANAGGSIEVGRIGEGSYGTTVYFTNPKVIIFNILSYYNGGSYGISKSPLTAIIVPSQMTANETYKFYMGTYENDYGVKYADVVNSSKDSNGRVSLGPAESGEIWYAAFY